MATKVESFYIQLNPREAWQTPAFRRPEQALNDGSLLPPARQIYEGTIAVLNEIRELPMYYVELPTPASSPSAAMFAQRVLHHAKQIGIEKRVPMHVRMTPGDMKLAMAVGGKAIHGMGNPSVLAGEKGQSIQTLFNTLDSMEYLLLKNGMQHFRASLEHALHTPEENVVAFINGLCERNTRIRDQFGHILYTAVGLPDTNGDGTPEQYLRLLSIIQQYGGFNDIKLFVHLHKDNGRGVENARVITKAAADLGISVVIEITPDERFPGERIGILDPVDLREVATVEHFPQSARTMMEGSSWKEGIPEYGEEIMGKLAAETNVAGIHTDHKERYGSGNGWAAPGLYGVMGKRNIAEIQNYVLGVPQNDSHTLAAAALLGRELSAQDGHLSQSYAIRFAEITYQDPGFVRALAQTFGDQDEWLTNPLPNLNSLRKRLDLPLR